MVFSLLLESGKKEQNKDSGEKRTIFNMFFLFFMPFLLMSALSLLWSWSIFNTLNELNILVWVLGAVYLFSIIDRKDKALKAIVSGATVLGICAIIQSKVLFPKLIEAFKGGRYADIASIQSIPFGSFLYHNVFGGYMSFILPLALYFGICKKKRLFEIAAIFIMAGIALSTSRIAMGISFLFLTGYIFFLIKEKNIRDILNLLVIVAITIVLVFLLIKTGREGELRGLTNELDRKAHVSTTEIKTLNTRTEIWKNAFTAFLAHPATGVGSGATEFGYRRYFDGGIYTKYTHSVILKILVELGIVGLLCFLFYLTGFFYFSWKRSNDIQYVFVFASVLCGIVFGVFDFSFDMPAHRITFFILSSLAFKGKKEPDSGEEKPKNLTVVYSLIKKTPIVLILIAILASFMFTVKVCLARKSIEIAGVLEENGFIGNAYQAYNEAIKEMPLDSEGYIKSVSILKRLYENESSASKKAVLKEAIISMLEKMERIKEKDSQVYFIMGLTDEALENEKKAEGYLLKAISYYPSSAHYISELIRFYLVRGELEKAQIWVQEAKKYFDRYLTSKNPVGLYICKIRDMEAEIEFRKGNKIKALSIAKDNLLEVINDKYIISNIKTGLIVPKDRLVQYLKGRADRFSR